MDLRNPSRSTPRHPTSPPGTVTESSLDAALKAKIDAAGNVTPAKRVPFGNATSDGFDTNAAFTYDGTILLVAGVQAVTLTKAQSLSNKTLFGVANNALNYDGATNNAPVEMFGAEVRGAAGAGPGAAGLAARVPFRASNSVGTVTRAGAIEGGWLDPTNGSEQGYTAIGGSYAGVAYPIVRATAPAATAGNGLNVQGATMGNNPMLSPFGLGADLGLDFNVVGAGRHRFYGQTELHIVDDGTANGGLSLNGVFKHQLTVAPAALDMGAATVYSVLDYANVESEIAYVIARVSNATPGSVQGSIEVSPADGMGGSPGAGLLVAPEGAASAKVNGAKIVPAATGGDVQYTAYGEADVSIALAPKGNGFIRPSRMVVESGTVAQITGGSGVFASPVIGQMAFASDHVPPVPCWYSGTQWVHASGLPI